MSEYGRGPHVAVDAVVFYYNHDLGKFFMLVIERQDGTIALPGGFVDPDDESLAIAASRELSEETAIDVSPEQWISIRPFTNRDRDPRSWVISFPFALDLGDYIEHPKCQAGDDAKRAFWLDIKKAVDFYGDDINWFADHQYIVNAAIEKLFI